MKKVMLLAFQSPSGDSRVATGVGRPALKMAGQEEFQSPSGDSRVATPASTTARRHTVYS